MSENKRTAKCSVAHSSRQANSSARNNSVNAEPGDVGSPWAIGSAAGGHDAIDPELGTFDDFDAFVARAEDLGMEIAIDLALQCEIGRAHV